MVVSEHKSGFVAAFLEEPGNEEFDCLKVLGWVFMLVVFLSAYGVFQGMPFVIRSVNTQNYCSFLTYKIQIPPNT